MTPGLTQAEYGAQSPVDHNFIGLWVFGQLSMLQWILGNYFLEGSTSREPRGTDILRESFQNLSSPCSHDGQDPACHSDAPRDCFLVPWRVVASFIGVALIWNQAFLSPLFVQAFLTKFQFWIFRLCFSFPILTEKQAKSRDNLSHSLKTKCLWCFFS